MVKRAQHVHIVTHHDADGITAGAIAKLTCERCNIDHTIECVKQLDETLHQKISDENHELVWFTDLGSSITNDWQDITKIITDHHSCPQGSDHPFHLNPHLFSYDGSTDISGAGTTYMVAKAVSKKNMDLAGLAIVGAIGDLQDRKNLRLTGLNRQIIEDGVQKKVLNSSIDLRYFGKETRPLAKLLQYVMTQLSLV